MSELENYIHTYFGVPKDELAGISSFFKPMDLKKGEYFLKTGRYADRLGFIQSGIVREFVQIGDEEITKWISTKGYFIVDLSSFVFQLPARWNIQALTDCELFTIGGEDYKRLGHVVPNWAQLEKLFIAKCFRVLEDRIISHLAMTAEERYGQLLALNSDLVNQVPLQYLASMLGMRPETLSRLRKKATGQTS